MWVLASQIFGKMTVSSSLMNLVGLICRFPKNEGMIRTMHYIHIYTHHWELMKLVGSPASSLWWSATLWVMLKRLWLHSSSCYLQIVVVEICLQFHMYYALWQLSLHIFFNSFKCNVGWDGEAECRVWHWGDRITTPPYSTIREHPWSWACELSQDSVVSTLLTMRPSPKLSFSLLRVAFWLAVCGAILGVSFFPLGGWCCTSRVPHLCKLHQVAWPTEQQHA
jgi:hypothetical protein